ncbi:esterase/lipase family protein [Ralstonia pseudosolanacearum]|uniref:esterase/lipase family protein n=1 Tax=Ralstonia pseudosolanacearum TaxID=1310165 RepID=UPI001FF710F3|nr:triacylglycerol lipase [Ralstonia pseudosolanacearum]
MTRASLPAAPVPWASVTAANARRAAVVLQGAATLGVAYAVHRWAALDWRWAAVAALGALTGSYLVSVGWAFVIALTGLGTRVPDEPEWRRMTVPPAQRLGIGGALSCWLRECVSVAWIFNVLQPFRARAAFAPTAPGPARVPVLMLHGYGCNRAVWLLMQRALAAAGHPAEAIDLMPLLGDIDHYASTIADAVTQMTHRYGRAPVLLCHSMGGLAARAFLRQTHGAPAVARVITLGTPHRGTAMARAGRGRNVRQMAWANPWLRELAAAETPATRERITSIFSWHDSIVGPPGAAWLTGARHVPLSGIGHVSLLCDARVRGAVLAELARIDPPGPALPV